MNCLSCSVNNPDKAKFCSNCGASLSFERPTNSNSKKSNEAYKIGDSKTGSEYSKTAIAFTSIFLFIVVAMVVSLSNTGNDSKSEESNLTDTVYVEPAPEPVVSSETIGESSAKRKAESYLSISGFSKKGLIDQLKFEGFTSAEATYGVENIVVDWNVQAGRKAESYMSLMGFSATGLMEQLVFEGFTKEQAAYGAYVVGFR
jgi:hypothetical protein